MLDKLIFNPFCWTNPMKGVFDLHRQNLYNPITLVAGTVVAIMLELFLVLLS